MGPLRLGATEDSQFPAYHVPSNADLHSEKLFSAGKSVHPETVRITDPWSRLSWNTLRNNSSFHLSVYYVPRNKQVVINLILIESLEGKCYYFCLIDGDKLWHRSNLTSCLFLYIKFYWATVHVYVHRSCSDNDRGIYGLQSLNYSERTS